MKFLFDNNLSPHLARAIAALSEPDEHVVVHLRLRFKHDTPDVEWISTIASEGGWCVVTQDRLIRNPLEREALRKSAITAFILAKGWASLKEWDKAWQLVRWWPRIVEQAGLITGGAAFDVPVRLSGKGKFQQIKL